MDTSNNLVYKTVFLVRLLSIGQQYNSYICANRRTVETILRSHEMTPNGPDNRDHWIGYKDSSQTAEVCEKVLHG